MNTNRENHAAFRTLKKTEASRKLLVAAIALCAFSPVTHAASSLPSYTSSTSSPYSYAWEFAFNSEELDDADPTKSTDGTHSEKLDPSVYMDPPEQPLDPIFATLEPISISIGETAREIIRLPRADDADMHSPAMLVYANVDEIDLADSNDDLLLALRAAVSLNKRILLESGLWSREQVEAVARKILGENFVPHRNSALMLIERKGNDWEIRRSYDAIVASLGRTDFEQSSLSDEKALGGSYKMPLYDFMAATYNNATSVNGYTVYRSTDKKVAVFIKDSSYTRPWPPFTTVTTRRCKVGWRGTKMTDIGDVWIDVWGQVTSWLALANPTFDVYNTNIVGQGYGYRFDNLGPWVNSMTTSCDKIDITGHSLGGAMAFYHAWRWSYTQANGLFKKVDEVVGFNAPGVGNSVFTADFQSRVGNTAINTAAFCRYGDPVNGLPNGFTQFCDFYGDQIGFGSLGILENHDADKWSQCRSSSSC